MNSSWKKKHFQDQPGCFQVSMPPNIGFNFSFFLTNSVMLFLINFHYSFFLLDTDVVLHIGCKTIFSIPKLFHTQPVLLFNQLLMFKSYSKTLFLFYVSLFWFFSNQVFRLSLQTTWLLYSFFQTKNIIKLHSSRWCLNFTFR